MIAVTATTAALIAAGVAVAGTVATVIGQRQQAKAAKQAQGEQRKAQAISNAQQSISRAREVRQVIAQQRVLQAEQLQAGQSSGFAGAVSAIGSDTGSALGAAFTQEGAARGIARAQGRASELQLKASSPNTFTQLGSFASGISGSITSLNQAGFFKAGQ